MTDTVLLTGATGFLGMEVLARLLERDDVEVLALVRGGDENEARARLDGVLRTLYDTPPPDAGERVRALPGDVTADGLGLSDAHRAEARRRTTAVLHCAASVSFALSLAHAREINTAGTLRVIELAKQMPSLRRVVHVSTAYVAGRHAGRFREGDLDVDQSFRNSYERSKYEAELALCAGSGDLPLAVARPSIVVGERDSGWTPAFNVIYWPLQAFARGLLDRVPARADGRVDVVPVDYVADGLVDLLDRPEIRGTVHLVAGERAVTNAQLIDLACRQLSRPRPELVDPRDVPELGQIEAYLPYFDVRTIFDDRRARDALGIRPPALADYFPALLDYARAARWGKRPMTREAAAAALHSHAA